MANDVIIGASLQVDAGNTAPTIKEVREQIKQFKAELDNATVGSEQHKAALEKLAAANKQLNPTFQEHAGTLKGINEHLSSALPAFGKASEGAKGFGAALKALMMNPIVLIIAAIVAGLKFLYDAFTHTFEGAKKLEQVFAGVGKAVEVVTDRIFKLGGAIIKFFSGDFKGAVKDAKAAVTGVGEEISEVYNRTVELTKRIQQLNREQVDDAYDKKKRESRLALLREQLNDEEVSVKEKKKIAAELRDDEQKNAKEDLERITKLNTAKIELLKIGTDAEKKNYKEIKELLGEIEETKKENALEGVRTNKVIRNLDKQERAEETARRKEENDKAKEAKAKAREREKAEKERHRAYTEQLEKLQQENALALIRDAYAKRLQEQKYASQKEIALIEQNFKEGKLKRSEFNTLIAQQTIANNNRIQQINDEHDKEVALKQKEKDDAAKKKLQEDLAKERELGQKEIALKIAMSKKKYDLQRQELDYKQAMIEDQYKKELAAAQGNALRIREVELKHNEDYYQISEARKTIAQSEADARMKLIDAIGNALGAVGQLIGEQTAAGKALSIASSLIHTYEGIAAAIKLGPAGIPAAIAVGATGFAAVQKIVSTKIPGQSSSSVSTGSLSSITAPLQPKATQQSTTLDQASINAIGNSTNKVYVLESDISNNRERIERINRQARIG
jgi:hypothetical protein